MFSSIKIFDPLKNYKDNEIALIINSDNSFLGVMNPGVNPSIKESYYLFNKYSSPQLINDNPDYLKNFSIGANTLDHYLRTLWTSGILDPFNLPKITNTYDATYNDVSEYRVLIKDILLENQLLINEFKSKLWNFKVLNTELSISPFINLRTYGIQYGTTLEIVLEFNNGSKVAKFIYYHESSEDINADDYFKYSIREDVLFIKSLTNLEFRILNVYTHES